MSAARAPDDRDVPRFSVALTMLEPVHCERCTYADGIGLVPSAELDMPHRPKVPPGTPDAWRTAAVIAGRALFFGIAIWVVLPPTGLAAVARAIAGTYLLMAFWWYFTGPGPLQRWRPAAAFSLGNLVVALLVARLLLFMVGMPGR